MQGGSGDKVVPQAYIATLAVLTDKAPFHPFAEMEEVLREDLGGSAADLFATFEEMPIAAASLAQVSSAPSPDATDSAVISRSPGASLQKPMASAWPPAGAPSSHQRRGVSRGEDPVPGSQEDDGS